LEKLSLHNNELAGKFRRLNSVFSLLLKLGFPTHNSWVQYLYAGHAVQQFVLNRISKGPIPSQLENLSVWEKLDLHYHYKFDGAFSGRNSEFFCRLLQKKYTD